MMNTGKLTPKNNSHLFPSILPGAFMHTHSQHEPKDYCIRDVHNNTL